MKYKVVFENNLPFSATLVQQPVNAERAEFEFDNGRSMIKYLYLDAESELHAIVQATRIVDTIFSF